MLAASTTTGSGGMIASGEVVVVSVSDSSTEFTPSVVEGVGMTTIDVVIELSATGELEALTVGATRSGGDSMILADEPLKIEPAL